MADWTIKQDDTLPALVATLKSGSGASAVAIDLSTGVTGVKFIMRDPAGGSAKVNAACTITTPASGIVTYDWASGDTDTAGTFNAEFQITYASGKILTVPNSTNLSVLIVPDLGD